MIGFIAAAYIVGILMELRYDKSLIYLGFSMLIGNIFIYIFGLFWLVKFVGESQALQMGLMPFIVGDILKILVGAIVLGSSVKINEMISSRG